MIVKWKKIKGYEGLYKISSQGVIRSLDRTHHCLFNGGKIHSRKIKGVELKQNIGKIRGIDAYKVVCLWKDGKKKHLRVHQLLAIHFLKRRKGDVMVNHKDGNKLNNSLENLEWCTCSENQTSDFIRGTRPTKLKKYEVIRIRAIHRSKGESFKKLGKKFNVSSVTIANIVYNRHWRHLTETK